MGYEKMVPPRTIPSICTFCAEGCGFYTLVEREKVLSLEYLKEHPVNKGGLCSKGNIVTNIVHHPERINSPLLRKEDSSHQTITWDEAIDLTARTFKKIAKKFGPQSLAFITSAYCTNETNYLLQKLARVLGTHNVDCISFYEGNADYRALITSLGQATSTNPFSDIINAKCILISGSNFFENHPVFSYWIFEAKSQGAKVIYLDHREPPSLLAVDLFLQLNPGTHAHLIEGMIIHLLENNLINQDFITHRTTGFDSLKRSLRHHSLKASEKLSGIPAARIREAAQYYATSGASAIIHCTDFNAPHSPNSLTTLANLALLCGYFGYPGAGFYTLPDHCNAQGCYDMGVSPTLLPGQVSIQDEQYQKLISKLWNIKKLPSQKGLSFPELIGALQRGKIKALYLIESNPLGESLHAHQLKQGLKNVEFVVVQDLFLNETAQQANLILPARCWAEKNGTYTNVERRVQWQSEIITSRHQIPPDWEVLCSLAKKLGFKRQFSYRSPEFILKEINRAISAYAGISFQRLKNLNGLLWPCPTSNHPGTTHLYTERFATPDGQARLHEVSLTSPREKQTSKYPYYLTFGKSPGFYNATQFSSFNELFVEMNPRDAKKTNIHHLSEVRIITKLGNVKATACLSQRVLPGIVFIPFLPAHTGYGRIMSERDPRIIFQELNTTTCQIKSGGMNK